MEPSKSLTVDRTVEFLNMGEDSEDDEDEKGKGEDDHQEAARPASPPPMSMEDSVAILQCQVGELGASVRRLEDPRDRLLGQLNVMADFAAGLVDVLDGMIRSLEHLRHQARSINLHLATAGV